MTRRLLGGFLVLLLVGASPAAAAAADAAGTWAVRSAGATLFVLDVKHGQAGWSAVWVRPAHFHFEGAAISKVTGPVVRRTSMAGRMLPGGAVELVFADPEPRSSPDRFTLRPLDAKQGELAWQGVADHVLVERAAKGTAPSPAGLAGGRFPLPFHWTTNAEMTAMFEADQAPRLGDKPIDWDVLSAQDEERRKRTKALLDAGALSSGDDFYHAAFIFQHGGKPDDYLLAHSLAMVAVARGRPDATWIGAATLDRYLQSVGQKQVFGTQYMTLPGKPTTQEPYNRALLSDALRAAMGVPPQADQEKRRAEIEARRQTAPKP